MGSPATNSSSEPLVSQATLDHFAKQLAARRKARQTKAAKEKRYNERVEKTNSKRFADLKEQVIGDVGGGQRPS